MRPVNPLRHPFRVARAPVPRAEGRFHLPNGRRLGFAEYGDPSGEVVLWFHGTPGGRRQFPALGRRAADDLGLRVVAVEWPGTHLSDPHRYENVSQWATDMHFVACALGAERLAVIGLSGGGPYALACGAVSPLAGRVAAVGVLGGVTPTVGPEACAVGVIDLTRRFAPLLTRLRWPLSALASGLALPMLPLGHYAFLAYAATTKEGDRRVLADPEVEPMLLDDFVVLAGGRFRASWTTSACSAVTGGSGCRTCGSRCAGGTATPTPSCRSTPRAARSPTSPTPNSCCGHWKVTWAGSAPPRRLCSSSAGCCDPNRHAAEAGSDVRLCTCHTCTEEAMGTRWPGVSICRPPRSLQSARQHLR